MELREILVKFKTDITIIEAEDKERNDGVFKSQHNIYDQAEQSIIQWAINKLPKEKKIIDNWEFYDKNTEAVYFNQAITQVKKTLRGK